MTTVKHITCLNEIGMRPQLEDSVYPMVGKADVSDRLFLVCDGVGGESMGEEASRIACEAFATCFTRFSPENGRFDQAFINDAQGYVLEKMRDYAAEHPEATKMSTTLTLVYLGEKDISVAWCGDSRIYHLRNGEVIWRSTDHSLVANLVKHGEITEEEAKSHPQRNVITRSLSASGAASEIDTYHLTDIQNGDYIMLCTDGVLEQITDDRLKGILLNDNQDKKSLFLSYCKGKTKDNFSLYLLELNAEKSSGTKKSYNITTPILILLTILAVLAIVFKNPIQNWLATKNEPKNEAPKNQAVKPKHEPGNNKPVVPPQTLDSSHNESQEKNNNQEGKTKLPANHGKDSTENTIKKIGEKVIKKVQDKVSGFNKELNQIPIKGDNQDTIKYNKLFYI